MNLTDLLNSALVYARSHPGRSSRVDLPRGLTVIITIQVTDTHQQIILRLSRHATVPSPTELTTVWEHWPQDGKPRKQPPYYGHLTMAWTEPLEPINTVLPEPETTPP